MSLFSQSCAEATRLLSASQDAPLPLTARVGLRLHLAICRHCQRYQRQLQLMRRVLQQYPENLPPVRLPEDFRRQLARELERLS